MPPASGNARRVASASRSDRLNTSRGRARQTLRRQRRERITGVALAVLGVVVLVISIYALRQPSQKGQQAGSTTARPKHSTSSSPKKSATPKTSASSAPSVAGKLPLVVLNNTTIAGLASQAKATFVAGGWQVSSVGNLQNNIISTCAYYDPNTAGAQQAAEALMRQFPAIKRTAPKFDGLPPGPIVVVLTPDYTSG